MNISAVKNQLYAIFLTTDLISIDQALEAIQFSDDCPDDDHLKRSLIFSAWNDLEEAEIIRVIRSDWAVLNRPLQSFPQQVELSASTCNLIGDTVNNYCALVENTSELVEKIHIREKDIENLCIIVEELLRKATE